MPSSGVYSRALGRTLLMEHTAMERPYIDDGVKGIPTFRTEALILANLLSVKPHLALSPELQHVPGLLRAVEDDGGLSRETQDLHPHKGVEHPPRGGGLEACAFVVRQGGLVVLERG